MLIDPRVLFSNLQVLAVVIGLILAGKCAIWFGIVRLFGYPANTALRVSIGLTQIGEFSFVLASLSLHSSLITEQVYNSILAASLFTILVNATLFKLLKAEPAALLQENATAPDLV
jgi:monovalent cation:H+ antiporter-2, CPA2 family